MDGRAKRGHDVAEASRDSRASLATQSTDNSVRAINSLEGYAMIRACNALWKAIAATRHATTERRFVFIITYARSGSTLLQKIIASIPGCHFNGENCDVLGGLYASFRSASFARDDQGKEPRTSSGDPWRGAHLINPQRYNRRLAAAFVDEILQPPASAWLIGFKEVRYFDYEDNLELYLDYIRMTFTPALLVFNRRNPADVAKSAWWGSHSTDIEAEVRDFDERTSNYAERHPNETIIVNYDDYCRDAESVNALFYRLGADFDPSVVKKIMSERLTH
jgi:Sulfotransferase family